MAKAEARELSETRDMVSVGSRVRWSAIFAGAVIALALNVILGVLGVAFGLSFGGEGGEWEAAALIYAVIAAAVSLFIGGFVASQTTAGETKGEALVYGVLVWALLVLILPVLVGLGGTLGFGALLGQVNPAAPQTARVDEETLRAAGLQEEQVRAVRDAQEKARGAAAGIDAAEAAWWTLGGMVLSLIAAVLGAIVGAGPEMVFAALYRRTVVVTSSNR